MKRTTNVMECGCPLGSLHVPVIIGDAEECHEQPEAGIWGACWRPLGHAGRHLTYWSHCGRVRAVWGERPGAEVPC